MKLIHPFELFSFSGRGRDDIEFNIIPHNFEEKFTDIVGKKGNDQKGRFVFHLDKLA